MSLYVDGFVLPLAEDKIAEYTAMSEMAGKVWKDHGALQYVEAKIEAPEAPNMTDFPKLAGAKAGETVIFAFITYNSREHRDEVNAKVMADPRLKDACNPESCPFDPTRMAYGGFKSIVQID